MVSDLSIKTEKQNNVSVIKLKGQVDLSNGHQLREAIDEQLFEGIKKLVIDTKNLNFIDSSALGILIAALRKIKEEEGSMIIVVNQYVERLITVAGLGLIFDTADDTPSAVERLKK